MTNNRFLLVQLADIGDLILTTPAIAALRESHPDAHMALLTNTHTASLIDGAKLVDEIITFDKQQFNSSKSLFRPANLRRIFGLRKGRYDTVVFFHHFTLKLGTVKFALIAWAAGCKRRIGLDNGNGWFLTESIPDGGFGTKHQAQYWLDLVGLLGTDTSPRPAQIAIDKGDQPDYAVGLSPLSKHRIIIHPGSGGYSFARRWSPQKFAAVADALHNEYGAQIILVGTPDDGNTAVKSAMQNEPLDLTGKTTLKQLAAVIQSADLYIGADSGIMHIAAATGTPVIAIFGPSNHAAWKPWTPGSKSIVIRSAPACSPCSYIEHTVGLREGCAARTCMHMVTAEQVLDAARTMLDHSEIRHDVPAPPQPRPTTQMNIRRIHILDLPVDVITYNEWLMLIDDWVQHGERCHHVCTTNPEFIMAARKDLNFRLILTRADLCVPDGVGLLWAAKRQGEHLPERVTGSDGVPIIAERAAEKGWKLFFLGAAPGVADKAADILREKYPGLHIVGVYAGSPAPEEEDKIVEMVNSSGADILFVAYGAPKQDKWIARNLPRLSVKMAMGVGGAFDFITGLIPRAPLWMRQAGLEWLYRLYRQPWRIKRMMRIPRFILAVLLPFL